ncbi:hypothetical protein SAMN06295926_10555 [Lysinibacillus sp. AC-3]|nr:hypothetical protein SAMN06295926_10555 [Lysinibacillus sp. AC-3]
MIFREMVHLNVNVKEAVAQKSDTSFVPFLE